MRWADSCKALSTAPGMQSEPRNLQLESGPPTITEKPAPEAGGGPWKQLRGCPMPTSPALTMLAGGHHRWAE